MMRKLKRKMMLKRKPCKRYGSSVNATTLIIIISVTLKSSSFVTNFSRSSKTVEFAQTVAQKAFGEAVFGVVDDLG